MKNSKIDKEVLNNQNKHWENTFSSESDMFGNLPSIAAIKATQVFKKNKKKKILELGGGQGRDTVFFAQNDFSTWVLDYSKSGVDAIRKKVEQLGFSPLITATCHDVRKPLPFEDNYFDGCFSHMLYCMAFTTEELEFLSSEIRRVLKPSGLNIYTVRHTGDAHYGTGIHRGEDMYEVGGFVVHFFSKEKVMKLAKGYELVDIIEFEEGLLPRKLMQVTLKK